MLKLFGVALAGATATTALSACAAPQPKYAIARPALTVEMASPPAADPAASFAQIKVEAPAPAEGDAETQAAIAAPLGSVDSAALPAIAVAAVQAAPPAAEPQASEPSAVGLAHVVGPGETFFAVGRRYGVTPQAVAETNGLTFSSTLRVGQRLTLPAGARDRGAQAAFPNRALALAPAPEPARRPARLAEAPAPLPSAPRPLAAPVQASSTPATDPESVAAAPSLSPAPTPLLSSAVAAAAAAPQPVVPAPMSVAAVQTAPVPTAPVQADSPPANPVSTIPQPSAPTPLPARTP
jgi:LysM repeat protein